MEHEKVNAPVSNSVANVVQTKSTDAESSSIEAPPYQLQTTDSPPPNNSSSGNDMPFMDQMSQSFGHDFSNVNIHTNSQEADQLNAKAFTTGNHVHFKSGEYNPGSESGKHLIAHELTHVVQQSKGDVKPTTNLAGKPVNDSPALEKEADTMATKAISGNMISSDNPIQGKFSNSEVVQRHPGHGTEPEPAPANDQTNQNTQTNQNSDTQSSEGEVSELSIADRIERTLFDLQNVWGPRSLVPPLFSGDEGYGGFEATYIKDAQSLNVTVRGKTQLINGLDDDGTTITSNQEDLDSLANILNIIGDSALTGNVVSAYTWTEDKKAEALESFRTRLGESIGIWENTGLEFSINKPGWEDIKAYLNVTLDVAEEGSLGNTAARETEGQHQQIKIFKTADSSEIGPIRDAVDAAITQYETDNSMSIGRVSDYDVRAYVDGQDDGSDYADTNAHNGSMFLSSNDLNASQANVDESNLSQRVFFANNSSRLDTDSVDTIKWFIDRFKGDGDGNLENNAITLIGHTSSSGTDAYNDRLAQRRINAVKRVIKGEGVTNVNDRIVEDNQGENAAGSDPMGNDAYHRAVDIKIGSGERQNTVAHEFGHVFGLADEYEEGGRSAGDNSGHTNLSQRMGTGNALVENNDGIISMGNEVRQQHYTTFVWALRELTGKPWTVGEQS